MARRRSSMVMVLALLLTVLPLQLPTASGGPRFETRDAVVRGLAASGPAVAAGGTASSQPTMTPIAFSMIAFEAPADSELTFRTRFEGRWQDWSHADFMAPDEGPEVRTGPTAFTDAIWVRAADTVQVRVKGARPQDVTVHVIDSTGVSLGVVERAVASVGAPEAEAATSSWIVSRAQWGADEKLRREEPSYARPLVGVVHHTAGSNDYTRSESAAIVRGIYHYHVKSRGWSDIGYNFLVDKYGQVFEGRFGGIRRGVVGAHAANFNTGSFGVAAMGNFEKVSPSSSLVGAVTRVLAWKFEVHGINPRSNATSVLNGIRMPTIIGHRDVGQTSCPGGRLYALMGTIRARVEASVAAGWVPVSGDWDGDGVETAGWFKDGRWRITNSHDTEAPTWDFTFGTTGDMPIVGDWDGDGTDSVGIVRGRTWHLRNSNSSGPAQQQFDYGRTGDIPLPGNWDGDRGDEAGLIRDRVWHLNDGLDGGSSTWSFVYGRTTAGDLPLVGDWFDEGQDRVAIVRDGEWHLRREYAAGHADMSFTYGRVTQGDLPVVGQWTGGADTAAIVRGSGWYFRHRLGGGTADLFLPFPTPAAD